MCSCGGELTVWCSAHGDWVCDDCGCTACDEEECSDTCRKMVCEWCPEHDRQEGVMTAFVAAMNDPDWDGSVTTTS